MDGQHTATDIHPYDVRNHLASQIGRKPYHATRSRMAVRHDTHFAVGKGWLSDKGVNLVQRFWFYIIRKYFQITHDLFSFSPYYS